MRINELRPGDRITEQQGSHTIDFVVVAVRPAGRYVQITFRSPLGEACARYQGDAYITAAR